MSMRSFDYYRELSETIRVPSDPRATQVSLLLPMGVIFLFVYPIFGSFWISAALAVLLAIALIGALATVNVMGRNRALHGWKTASELSTLLRERQSSVDSAVHRAEMAARNLTEQLDVALEAAREAAANSYIVAKQNELWLYDVSINSPSTPDHVNLETRDPLQWRMATPVDGGTLFQRMARLARASASDGDRDEKAETSKSKEGGG